MKYITYTCFLFLCVAVKWSTSVFSRPRGVSISMATFYQYNEENPVFHCLDQSAKIPYEYINDEYCDCTDGSDEPGTSACPNGKYHCTNAGHTPLNIMSSRVNDGICDCCDGSDEYGEVVTCTNNCKELGKLAREEAERRRKQLEEGYKIKLSFSEEGKKSIEEKTAQVAEMEKALDDAKVERDAAETVKNSAEIPEKLAKDEHEKAWKEEKEKRDKEDDTKRAEEAFRELDLNKDGLVDVSELMLHTEFDIDNNGLVTEEEATEYMGEVTQANLDHFMEKMWSGMKEIYRPLQKKETEVVPEDIDQGESGKTSEKPMGETADPSPEPLVPDKHDVVEREYDRANDYGDDKDDDDEEKEDEKDVNDRATFSEEDDYKNPDEPTTDLPKEDSNIPEYDEATKKLIAAADEARSAYQASDAKVKDLEKSVLEIKEFLALDMGPDKEFFPIKDKCFELDEAEYTYILCPFSKATQRPKSGGSDTLLGSWGKWAGPSDDRYATMLYENGLGCWNGPSRSVKVDMHCGHENKLSYANEPNKCEYRFIFTTPARCTPPSDSQLPLIHSPHTEL